MTKKFYIRGSLWTRRIDQIIVAALPRVLLGKDDADSKAQDGAEMSDRSHLAITEVPQKTETALFIVMAAQSLEVEEF